MKKLFTAAAISVACIMGSQAFAASAPPCASFSPDVTGNVAPTSACYALIGTDGNVDNNPAEFNATNFGGFADWSDLGTIQAAQVGLGSNANFEIAGNTLGGTWSVFSNATTSLYDTFVLLFKAGVDNNTDPSAQVGYVLSASNGNWSSPLLKSSDGSPRNISHVELYARSSGGGVVIPPIPVPATLPLLLGAMGLGFGLSRRKSA